MVFKKRRSDKNSRYFVIGFFLFLIGFSICGIKYCGDFFISLQEENAIEEFFDNEDRNVQDVFEMAEEVKNEKKNSETKINYVAVLEIPKINLKRGLFDIYDKNNNVNKNIEIIKGSNMPDVNGNFILAAHSGYSSISYFRHLDDLEKDDFIYVYYHGKRFDYKIINIYDVKKTGTIDVYKNSNKNILTLITCRRNTDLQIIVTAELLCKEEY